MVPGVHLKSAIKSCWAAAWMVTKLFTCLHQKEISEQNKCAGTYLVLAVLPCLKESKVTMWEARTENIMTPWTWQWTVDRLVSRSRLMVSGGSCISSQVLTGSIKKTNRPQTTNWLAPLPPGWQTDGERLSAWGHFISTDFNCPSFPSKIFGNLSLILHLNMLMHILYTAYH